MLFLLILTGLFSFSWAQTLNNVRINPEQEIKRLLGQWDRDRDQKITILDSPLGKSFEYDVRALDGKNLTLQGAYHLSNLLQELKLLEEDKKNVLIANHIFENPVHRISRSIRDRYWDGLTRRIDKDHLKQVLGDSKTSSGKFNYLYVPYNDVASLEYYLEVSAIRPDMNLKVVRLPEKITPEYVQSLNGKHGLLTLALQDGKGVPYVVPGGRFNEMYGWDSYFEALGLLKDGRVDLAKSMVDNFVYQITHYGKILNANRTYYLTRSQPPFLTSMIRAVLEKLPNNKETKAWLEISLRAAIKEYHSVWMGEDRLTSTGLSRYYGNGPGVPPEVEPGHYNHILAPLAKKHRLSIKAFRAKYESGKLKESALDEFLKHDRAVRESGHDTTYRWRVDGKDRCADFVTVDLNSLLYKYELDLASLIERSFDGNFENLKSKDFYALAAKRKEKIREYLWDKDQGIFFDYHVPTQKKSTYISATALWPLWAFDPSRPSTKILSDEEASKLIHSVLHHLEVKGGLAATAESSLKKFGDKNHLRQWDWPNGWAPHQMLGWEGLIQYGHNKTATRLIYKWLYMITRNATDYNGTIPEKYDVLKRSHAVFAEYGNVGTHFSYITKEGFGWMNASYQFGLAQLNPDFQRLLERLIPPEWINFDNVAYPMQHSP